MTAFEWDEAKRRSNIEKHGLDFREVEVLFDGRALLHIPSRRSSEDRVLTFGRLGDQLIAVVWTERGEGKRRIISARRARDAEERQHRQLYC